MIDHSKKGVFVLDPRTKMILLIAINIFIFTNSDVKMEVIIILGISLLLVVSNLPKVAIKGIIIYVGLVAAMYLIVPYAPKMLLSAANILFVFIRKILPCGMLGSLLIKTTPIRLIMLSLQRWKIPQNVTIPLAITIRYFPALKEESQAIHDAMKLRNVKGVLKKFEYIYVPLLVSASHTADELSQAIVTRGIENPKPKTCAVEMKFKIQDYILLTISFAVLVLVFIPI
ncbi:UNVERIFIED_ORG: cobalt transporter [Clostridium botulinum]|uniref:Energy-coupling factor transporter transmembrane protein EcfT n=1 Tax=Clostridium botulinum TaxID=1491 RepID=A0A6M0SNR4_CLOBO|nr:energy-coupling factor transporter transmembrane component T [Clostridium botulinum]NFA42931.1 energy-coupling factor transporter transmembrane protein EcfT [Clostridium botulinum]NFO11015.1 energy-coupling factor transporter transmembrane protein EcfT [Clostridium botulinum]